MASSNPLRRAVIRRKWLYFGLIVGLFTVSIFWRGKLDVPFGNPARAAEQAPTALNRTADTLSRYAILNQSERLDLRELDQGDPEIAGSAMRLSLVGARGVVLTVVWRGAIEKQKRNEFHEFEMLARFATRLQPHFITPWMYQSWNIAYNVSVENDKLGDMYFYIARGIELLGEGDRLNTRRYVDSRGVEHRIGSPDIRYQAGFYYQNKFGVSDKVQTLRSLMQLSCINPSDRNPDSFKGRSGVDEAAFRAFCEKNPQLVRRLRTKLNCARPSDVVQFLRDNDKIPHLYAKADPEDTENFPLFPPRFAQGPDEYYPGHPVDDSFDAFHAARAWYAYSLTVVPPPRREKDAQGNETGPPLPWMTPRPGEYDPFLYRVPRAPTLIIFRQGAPRAQSYLAERLMKEGWFDEAVTWDPDENANPANTWFAQPVPLRAGDNARQQWAEAWRMWNRHGEENALVLPPGRLAQLQDQAGVKGTPTGLPPFDMSEEEMAARGLTPQKVEALRALVFYEQNRGVTNFPFFLEQSRAEKDPVTVAARKLLWQAEQAQRNGDYLRATRLYTVALARWREALREFPDFHRTDRAEEDTYEYELALMDLLAEDAGVRARAERTAEASRALYPALPDMARALVRGADNVTRPDDFRQAVAEDEAEARVVAEAVTEVFPRLKNPSESERQVVGRVAAVAEAAGALGAAAAEAARPAILRGVIDSEFAWMKEFKEKPLVRNAFGEYERSAYWVSPMTRQAVKSRLGRVRIMAPPEAGPGGGAPPAPGLPAPPPAGPPGS